MPNTSKLLLKLFTKVYSESTESTILKEKDSDITVTSFQGPSLQMRSGREANGS